MYIWPQVGADPNVTPEPVLGLVLTVQFAAQVRQCLRIRGLGPEQASDTLPGLRGSGVHDQECDQDDNARRPGPDASGPVVSNCLLP